MVEQIVVDDFKRLDLEGWAGPNPTGTLVEAGPTATEVVRRPDMAPLIEFDDGPVVALSMALGGAALPSVKGIIKGNPLRQHEVGRVIVIGIGDIEQIHLIIPNEELNWTECAVQAPAEAERPRVTPSISTRYLKPL